MKKITLAILTLFAVLQGGEIFAQGKFGADSAECIKYLSYYQEYYKQKNYDEALPNWRTAFKLCPPTASQNMLLNGMTLVKQQIGKAGNQPEVRKALMDTLFSLYDLRAQYYPKYAVKAYNDKGMDIARYMKGNADFLHENFKDIISRNGAETTPSLLVLDMDNTIELFKQNKLSTEDVINTYQGSLALLGEMAANGSKSDFEKEQIAKAKSDLEGLFITSKVASCENLISLFTPRFEAKPDDLDLVTNIVKMLGTAEDCTDNELFLKAVTQMHKLNPSYTSAYYLYRLNSSRGNSAEAVRYIEEAIASPECDVQTRAGYQMELATYSFKNGSPAKAYEAARKASEMDPSLAGKAYYLMGTIWGSTSCGGDEIARRSPYWVACDMLSKAKAADPSLTDDCNRLIGQYSVYFPEKADAFMYGLSNGQSYTVSCGGMRATTTVRTR